MVKRGKNINLYLIDGDVNGRIKCTLANWTGVIFKIPQTKVERISNREELKQSGIYFLFGSRDDNEKNSVYIGQASIRSNGEGLLYRINEHKNDTTKDYWTEAVAVTTSNNSFGPTEISYLEHRMVNIAKESNRYEVKNGNIPNIGNVTEEKQSELEDFLDNAKIVMGALGYKIFEKIMNEEELDTVEPTFVYEVKGIRAMGRRTSEGFVLLKGSKLSPSISEVGGDKIMVQREKYSDDIDMNNYLINDILFKSPSGAAKFVSGNSVNGNVSWKTQEGMTLGEVIKSN